MCIPWSHQRCIFNPNLKCAAWTQHHLDMLHGTSFFRDYWSNAQMYQPTIFSTMTDLSFYKDFDRRIQPQKSPNFFQSHPMRINTKNKNIPFAHFKMIRKSLTDNNQFPLWSQSSPLPILAGNFGTLTPEYHRNAHCTIASTAAPTCWKNAKVLSLWRGMPRYTLARWKTVLLLWLQNGIWNSECQRHVRILCTR